MGAGVAQQMPQAPVLPEAPPAHGSITCTRSEAEAPGVGQQQLWDKSELSSGASGSRKGSVSKGFLRIRTRGG